MNTNFGNQPYLNPQKLSFSNTPPPPPNLQFLQFQKQTAPLQFTRNRPTQDNNRVMYKSTIQPTTTTYQSTVGFGLGRL